MMAKTNMQEPTSRWKNLWKKLCRLARFNVAIGKRAMVR